MAHKIIRYDLDRVYRFIEYNEAINYANKYMGVKGVEEQVQNLQKELDIYKKDISAIVEPERKDEELKYNVWEKWFKANKICKWALAGFFLVSIINLIFLQNVLDVLWLFVILMIPAFIVTMIGVRIYSKNYSDYMNKLDARIGERNNRFANRARAYYEAIDNLYLNSLDPSHREMVLMRREQAEHNKELIRLKKEQQMRENERLEEERRMRKAQERMLEIEEERERDRKRRR